MLFARSRKQKQEGFVVKNLNFLMQLLYGATLYSLSTDALPERRDARSDLC